MPNQRSAFPPWIWPVGVIAVFLTAMVLLSLLSSGPPRDPAHKLLVHWDLRPASSDLPPATTPGRLAVLLDHSFPVSGFVAPTSEEASRSAWTLLCERAGDHLVAATGGRAEQLEWFRIADDVQALPEDFRCDQRSAFTGQSSRLDRAVATLADRFEAGELEAALVLTDLVATGKLTGAQGALGGLRTWKMSPSVQAGRLHWSLLAVAAPYWGVRVPGCPRPDLHHGGCWLSELSGEYQPLPRDAHLPLYALLVGRDQKVVETLDRALRKDLDSHHLGEFVVSELLTASTCPLSAETTCRVTLEDERPHEALFAHSTGQLECDLNQKLLIRCPLPDSFPFKAESASGNGPFVKVELADQAQELRLVFDCEAFRQQRQSSPFELTLLGRAHTQSDDRWTAWTTNSDRRELDVGKTLNLDLALEAARLNGNPVVVTAKISAKKETR